MSSLQDEFKYFLDNREDFLSRYPHKVLVIKDRGVIGVYDSKSEAVEKTRKDHKMGTFLVQNCEPGDESVSMTFHSRFAFVQ